ncbi:MAG: hypothetical protein IK005_09790 [Paludibacteraceae bacterium]|nr:hypothetical protein [Paludibacteraceae bacterium]
MVYDEGLNRVDGVSGQTATSFAECATSSDYAKAEGKLPMLIGKGQNGVVMADLTALLHVLAYSTKSKELMSFIYATLVSLVDKVPSSQLNFVVFDLNGWKVSDTSTMSEDYFWNYPSRKNLIVHEQSEALRALDHLVKEIDVRYELLRKSRTHSMKEYSEAMEKGRIVPSVEFPVKPNIVLLVADFWRFVNESKAAEISLLRILDLGKSVGVHLVAATTEQPEIMNGDVLASFPSKVVFKTATQEASQALLFAPDAVGLMDGEIFFVKDKYITGMKNPRKIMTEGSIDVDFANKVASLPLDSGVSKLVAASANAEELSQICMKYQK